MTPATLASLVTARTEARAVVLGTRLPDGAQIVLPEVGAPAGLNDAAERAMRRDVSGTVQLAAETWFLQVQNPPVRLVMVGAVHVAQALVPLAVQLGMGVVVVDPRRSFASAERFPGVAIRTEWPDEALAALALDARCAVVTLTHDPKLDDPALDRALRAPCFYVGALGSRKTHAARLERLRALGHDEAALARIHGPVGLALGAVSAPEIALSALAQIVAVRRGGAAAS